MVEWPRMSGAVLLLVLGGLVVVSGGVTLQAAQAFEHERWVRPASTDQADGGSGESGPGVEEGGPTRVVEREPAWYGYTAAAWGALLTGVVLFAAGPAWILTRQRAGAAGEAAVSGRGGGADDATGTAATADDG